MIGETRSTTISTAPRTPCAPSVRRWSRATRAGSFCSRPCRDAWATKDGAAYSASKWGILGLMKSAALELGAYNITVNAICRVWSGPRSLTTSSVTVPPSHSRTVQRLRIRRRRKPGTRAHRPCRSG
ncbi:MAG: SDR family NAD(P)-dependent oxidoreductase [Hyphomicrobium sp.]